MPFPEDIFPNNQEVFNAYNLAEFTNIPLYITGKAGTGKSTFLKHYCKNTRKKFLVLAPTGLASLNVNGQTIHSFFGLPWRPVLPKDKGIPYFPEAKTDKKGNIEEKEHYKRTIIKNLDSIIIDEVSMVRPDLIDAINNSLRKNGGNYNLPFGGKQIIFIGDLFQLEPVVKNEDLPIISRFYDSPFFFSAMVFQQIQLSNIEFVKVYRQSDPKFIGLLDRIRKSEATEADFSTLNRRLNPIYSIESFGRDTLDKKHGFDITDRNQYSVTLTTKNDIAERYNSTYLSQLESDEYEYTGIIEGRFDNNLPTVLALKLKVGAQVMFVKNDSGGRWVNGSIGKVTELTDEIIKVKIKNNNVEEQHPVETVRWEKIEYKWNDKTEEIETEIVGTFTQFPLKLAWAITIHKSQGLTFDRVVIDSGDGMFTHGHLYVALSRCTSFNGLIFKKRIRQSDMIVDNRIVQIASLANNQETINKQLIEGIIERIKVLTEQLSHLHMDDKNLRKKIDVKNQKILELVTIARDQLKTIRELQAKLRRKKKMLKFD